MRLLPRADKEHHGRVSPEIASCGGLLSGVRVTGCNRYPVPLGLRWDRDSVGTVDGGEGCRMTVFGGHLGWGGASAPADRLHGLAEVPLAGVGLCAACHPGHRYSVSGGGG